jgi:branched-chain amino acid transport system permease protein
MSTTIMQKVDRQFRVRDALGAALVAGLVGLPMLGLTTRDGANGLQVETRWALLAGFIVVAFAGRLILQWTLQRFSFLSKRRLRARPAPEVAGNGALVWVGAACVAFAVLLPALFAGNRYVVDTATTVLIYVMLGWGLNVVVGLAGLLDLGYVAFYAVGAYTYGLLSTHFGFGFWDSVSGKRYPSPVALPRHSACCLAIRHSDSEATIWRSSRSDSARSSGCCL